MEGGFRSVLSRLPFAVKELHPDNGSEFFNNHLVRFWGEAITGLKLSQSAPTRRMIIVLWSKRMIPWFASISEHFVWKRLSTFKL